MNNLNQTTSQLNKISKEINEKAESRKVSPGSFKTIYLMIVNELSYVGCTIKSVRRRTVLRNVQYRRWLKGISDRSSNHMVFNAIKEAGGTDKCIYKTLDIIYSIEDELEIEFNKRCFVIENEFICKYNTVNNGLNMKQEAQDTNSISYKKNLREICKVNQKERFEKGKLINIIPFKTDEGFFCKECNYKIKSKSNFQRHLGSIKHNSERIRESMKKRELLKIDEFKTECGYCCIHCGYVTNLTQNFKRHLIQSKTHADNLLKNNL